ncbi:malectin domain-containing carbohydrate-binding protein [Flavisolibacter ginsenosidimutans]|uniref:malectin domain-containing carbohydrate-binding protein n=1 Tax=Flavisolibacter ginsenosidimutans TaxID=661481 RepID=UPI001D14EA4F|nr:malectin domain-containing carbohydrate-binding protein [Flavisolibacter ginsenosidimutans]
MLSSLHLSAQNLRTDISLNKGWYTRATDSLDASPTAFEMTKFDLPEKWKQVDVPHNWDDYYGYRRLRHGNKHGYAYYLRYFDIKPQTKNKRIFLFFEGVGSYATIWLNWKKVGYHAGGRTTFTVDITDDVRFDNTNILAVRADHPAFIQDLPWVCGGCSDDRGWSEGSQPMGIFRPVHLIITNTVRVEPFGVHIWNDTTVTEKKAQLYIETEVKNYSAQPKNVRVVNRLVDAKGRVVFIVSSQQKLAAAETRIVKQTPPLVVNPQLWSLTNPYLYNLVTEIIEDGKKIDESKTAYGIRKISWPINHKNTKQFLLNGKPVFINGIAEYEHLLGDSHAFSNEQIHTRVMEVKAAGFNAFRDAHQPHNLRYQRYWDSLGILWWPQMSAHDWYDTPEFRTNFKNLLKEWIKERRNSPSIILWGLQNESKLPEDFAKECTELIRQLDPTASLQRLVTTCNGGSGTDWDVPQNWTGTYGGNPVTYSEDLKRQILVGEYGAWRTIDLHTEGPFVQNGAYSEDRMTQLMEMKVRLAEVAKDSAAGHFMWLLTSHDNPGRTQSGEGYRELDRIGPVNYKGLLTPWEEPTDAYYMYRSNYVSKEKEPMVYIVSHTWPDRWTKPGKKDGIVVYSNCDEVELFNDVRQHSLGRKKRGGIGTHFQWDGVDVNYNVLYAVGYVNGKEVATDLILLHHLPKAPHFNEFYNGTKNITAQQTGYNYLYRVNCGGDDYKDVNGNLWLADKAQASSDTWGSVSWTANFTNMPPYFASQRTISEPIRGTRDWKLFQSFRYGRDKLRFNFPVQDGEYLVELYFAEPWHGKANINAKDWRIFDIAVNNQVVLKDLDVWKEAGFAGALKKKVKVKVTGGTLSISFPHIASGQAVISAIAISTLDQSAKPAPPPPSLIQNLYNESLPKWTARHWATTGGDIFGHPEIGLQSLPPILYGAEWIKPEVVFPTIAGSLKLNFDLSADADVYVAYQYRKPNWLKDFDDTKDSLMNSMGVVFHLYKKRFSKGEKVQLQIGQADWYPVFAVPASGMEPAYDLKPVASYKAVNATLGGNAVKTKIDGKDRVVFEKPSAENSVAWEVSVGVGDVYSLTVSYNNPLQQNVKGNLKLIAADGTLMKEEEVELTPTKAGKSNYISTTTGSMINAGKYKVVLAAKEAQGLSINALDVQ